MGGGRCVEAGGDAPVLIAADLAVVAADLFGELGLGDAGFGAQGLDSLAE